jgi:predicted transposase YbfD/YdcC
MSQTIPGLCCGRQHFFGVWALSACGNPVNDALGLNFKCWPSDATFLYLFNKAQLQEFGLVLQAWMVSQIPAAGSSCWSPATTRKSSTTTRRHLFLTGIRTTSENLLRLIRQRGNIKNEWHWARDAQLGEDANRYAYHIGVPVFSLVKTVVMNLLRRGGYRSTRQGLREQAYDIKRIQMVSLLETWLRLFLIRLLKLRLKPKAAAAPKIGRGPGASGASTTIPTG